MTNLLIKAEQMPLTAAGFVSAIPAKIQAIVVFA
jgi:hypothetical protein